MGRLFTSSVIFALAFGLCAEAGPAKPSLPDISLIRGALAGTWQSLDDTKFTRELDADGRAADRYEGDASATALGHWELFYGNAAPASVTGRKLEPNAVYLKLDENGDQLLFALVGLSRSELRMIYLERGNVLSFSRLK